MSWISSTGSCEESGVNQVTGEISGDWFGSIRTDEIFIQNVTKYQCNTCADVFLSSDTIDFSADYDVKARSCGNFMNKDLDNMKFHGHAFQVTYLTRKLEDRNLGKNKNVRGERPKGNSARKAMKKNKKGSSDLPDELVFLTLTYGTPFMIGENLNYPEQAVFTYEEVFENEGRGATQFVLQGENTIDFESWDCLEDCSR